MSENPHIPNAEYIDRAPELRLIDATLALAYEQRTANLLALHAALRERRDNRQALDLLTEIKRRIA